METGVTFVAVCHNETHEVDMFCSALLLQKDQRWNCVVVCNGQNDAIAESMSKYQYDKRFTYLESDTNTGAWGCYNRIKVLSIINSPYVINTSIQDYYPPHAVACINAYAGKDIIYWQCLHNHFAYDVLDSKLELTRIDWGSFAVKTEIAKAVGINHPDSVAADGLFIADLLAAGYTGNNHKIDKILTVHN